MSIVTQKNGTLEYLTAERIGVAHCFTTRLGGVSKGYLDSLNIGLHRGDDPANVEENFRILGQAIGFDPQKAVLTRQTHSDIVRKVGKGDWGVYMVDGASPESDALITNDPGTALVIFTADCTPILLWDEKTGAVGAVHAGWRGTAQNIAGKTVEAMCREFGCQPEDIHAAIGPNIGPCCFETDAEVPRALMDTYGPLAKLFIWNRNGKFYPDLKKINAQALKNAGVSVIDVSCDCTMCQPQRFWSHRVHGAQRGSQGAIIVCGEGKA